MGGGCLQEVVTHGGSTAQLLRIKALWKLNVENVLWVKKFKIQTGFCPPQLQSSKGKVILPIEDRDSVVKSLYIFKTSLAREQVILNILIQSVLAAAPVSFHLWKLSDNMAQLFKHSLSIFTTYLSSSSC